MASSPPPSPSSSLLYVGTERRSSPEYFWENRHRHGATLAVVQQTLSGVGFHRDAHGTRLVPVHHAMLFTHDDGSAYGYPEKEQAPYHLRYVSFELGALRPWWDQLHRDYGPVLRFAAEGESARQLLEIERRWRAREFRDPLDETEALHGLLLAITREQISASHAADPVEYGHHLIRSRFRSPQNLKELAAACGISREHFIRRFGQRYGESPGTLLRRLRLEHARALLRGTRLPIAEVARAAGFADAASLARAYRRRQGLTPGAERNTSDATAQGTPKKRRKRGKTSSRASSKT
jgi:AraC-like DNA-binding protein